MQLTQLLRRRNRSAPVCDRLIFAYGHNFIGWVVVNGTQFFGKKMVNFQTSKLESRSATDQFYSMLD